MNIKTSVFSKSQLAKSVVPIKVFILKIKNKLDIIFANEQEILSLLNAKSIESLTQFLKQLKKNIIITRGEKGAISFDNGQVFECPAKKNLNIMDLTGAGDLFAAGYLHGVINKMNTGDSLSKGTEMSSKIIQKIGARI